jgi:hypothetical protein
MKTNCPVLAAGGMPLTPPLPKLPIESPRYIRLRNCSAVFSTARILFVCSPAMLAVNDLNTLPSIQKALARKITQTHESLSTTSAKYFDLRLIIREYMDNRRFWRNSILFAEDNADRSRQVFLGL